MSRYQVPVIYTSNDPYLTMHLAFSDFLVQGRQVPQGKFLQGMQSGLLHRVVFLVMKILFLFFNNCFHKFSSYWLVLFPLVFFFNIKKKFNFCLFLVSGFKTRRKMSKLSHIKIITLMCVFSSSCSFPALPAPVLGLLYWAFHGSRT